MVILFGSIVHYKGIFAFNFFKNSNYFVVQSVIDGRLPRVFNYQVYCDMNINAKGKLLDLNSPKIMGILNLTPDSFYDGGKNSSDAKYLNHCEQMLSEGADIIDIGAVSTKPKVQNVSEDEELQRLIQPLESILKQFPEAIISVDTFRSAVAKKSIEAGAAMINDVSAGSLDSKMMEAVGKLKVPYVMMHMRGTPETMQQLTDYDDLVKDICFYFSEKIALARTFGISDIIIDPGFGFAKTTAQNFELLRKLEIFKMMELPILVGVSRKSMVYKSIGGTAEKSLNGTSIINTIALTKGANILRVHDVREAVQAVKLWQLTNHS